MQLALLSGASPRSCGNGPAVRLHSGKWILKIQGLIDSTLLLNFEGADNPIERYPHTVDACHDMPIHCDGTEVVSIEFNKRGNESYITVIAEKVA